MSVIFYIDLLSQVGETFINCYENEVAAGKFLNVNVRNRIRTFLATDREKEKNKFRNSSEISDREPRNLDLNVSGRRSALWLFPQRYVSVIFNFHGNF